jgi:hypothetical protein
VIIQRWAVFRKWSRTPTVIMIVFGSLTAAVGKKKKKKKTPKVPDFFMYTIMVPKFKKFNKNQMT